MDSGEAPDPRREALLKEYAEVTSNFRLLTEIRFKLLALLPIGAVAAAALKGTGAADTRTAAATLGLSLFGLIVTAGLMSYNARNDQLYDELVGRAAEIERRVGLPDGAFAHRPNAWLAIRLPYLRIPVDHRSSVAVIYAASMTLWLFGVVYSAVQLVAYNRTNPPWWALGGSAALAAAIAVTGSYTIAKQRRDRRKNMRTATLAAVRLAESNPSSAGFESWASSSVFRALCAGLLDGAVGASSTFRILCRDLRDETRKSEDAAAETFSKLCQAPPDRKVIDTVERRAAFYVKELDDASNPYCLPLEGEPPLTKSSYFIALIADLSPRWVLDCAMERREKIDLAMSPKLLASQESRAVVQADRSPDRVL